MWYTNRKYLSSQYLLWMINQPRILGQEPEYFLMICCLVLTAKLREIRRLRARQPADCPKRREVMEGAAVLDSSNLVVSKIHHVQIALVMVSMYHRHFQDSLRRDLCPFTL